MLDMLQKEIINFLVAISQRPVTQEASREISSLMHMVNDLEKVGDYCENLWEQNERKIDKKAKFSAMANDEIATLAAQTREFLEFVTSALEERKTDIEEQAHAMENGIDDLEDQYRKHHIARLNTGECAVIPGLIFIDMLHNFEKIGDHTHSISRAIIGKK
jgi:phosphate:Na+ symporter